jgi:hypothetical protein
MALRRSRKYWALAAVLTAGTAFQYLPTGCANYYTALTVSAFDFCAVFNCEGGTFFNFCEPNAFFWDCPNIGQATQ